MNFISSPGTDSQMPDPVSSYYSYYKWFKKLLKDLSKMQVYAAKGFFDVTKDNSFVVGSNERDIIFCNSKSGNHILAGGGGDDSYVFKYEPDFQVGKKVSFISDNHGDNELRIHTTSISNIPVKLVSVTPYYVPGFFVANFGNYSVVFKGGQIKTITVSWPDGYDNQIWKWNPLTKKYDVIKKAAQQKQDLQQSVATKTHSLSVEKPKLTALTPVTASRKLL